MSQEFTEDRPDTPNIFREVFEVPEPMRPTKLAFGPSLGPKRVQWHAVKSSGPKRQKVLDEPILSKPVVEVDSKQFMDLVDDIAAGAWFAAHGNKFQWVLRK